MGYKSWVEEIVRIEREAREAAKPPRKIRHRREGAKLRKDAEVGRILEAIAYADNAINEGRKRLGLPPLKRRRGPKPAPHPLPRRDPRGPNDVLGQESHVRDHRDAYVIGCQRCYVREYLYFKHHPDERPSGVWTAGTDEEGRNPRSRIYRPGWDPEKFPFKA